MSKNNQTMLGSLIFSLLIGILFAYAGGHNGYQIGSTSVFAIVVIISFVLNWLVYIPSMLAQTEHYYDLTGAVTYLSVITIALVFSSNLDLRSYIVACMVCFWAIRLGLYLYKRVKRNGKDGRFDEMKTRPLNFLVAWTIQALWVIVTASCALVIITSQHRVPLSWLGYIGIAVWLFGMSIELIADYQKSQFKNNPSNSGRYISHGLWAWSQHPNYFGEIVLWSGVAILALPIFSNIQWICIISPVFVFVLLRYVSGVNLSHEIGDERWGNDPKYKKYRENTPVLLLKKPSRVDN